MYKKIVVLLALVALGVCEEVAKDVKDCAKNADCVEKTVVKMIDEMDNQEKVEVLGDFLTVTKTGESAVARKDEGAFDRFLRFVSNHNMKIKFPTSEAGVQKLLNDLFTEARSSKLKKIILPLVLLFKLKAAVLLPAIISGIALVAFKGLGASLIALALAGATALKSAVEGHSSSKFTYEVVPPHSHWSRSGIESYPGYHTIPQFF